MGNPRGFLAAVFEAVLCAPTQRQRECFTLETSLVVQWLRLCAPNAGDPGSIPDHGTRSYVRQLRVLPVSPWPGGLSVTGPYLLSHCSQ